MISFVKKMSIEEKLKQNRDEHKIARSFNAFYYLKCHNIKYLI